MLNSDIIGTIVCGIEQKIGCEWKHEVGIYGTSSGHANFVIDGKEYVLRLFEVEECHNFSEYAFDEKEATKRRTPITFGI